MSWTVSDEEFSVYSSRVLRARPLGSLAASLMGVAAVAVLAGALLLGRGASVETARSSAPIDAAPAATPTPTSAEIFAPAAGAAAQRSAAFDLDVAELTKEKKAYSVQQREGGGRQDTLSFGEFGGGKLYLRLDILQTAGEKAGNSDFFLDMARHAAQAGLAVTRIGQPSPLASRLGAFESADIRLSPTGEGGASLAGGERGCLAVRLLNSKLSVEIAGLACGLAGKSIDRRVMSCLLDRLQYVPGGDDKALERFFSRTEPERGQGCFAAPIAQAPAATTGEPAASAKKRAAAARHSTH